MRFESHWPDAAIAARICGKYDQQDEFFERIGRSRPRVDGRLGQAYANPPAAVLLPMGEHARRREPGKDRLSRPPAEVAPPDIAGWRTWITSIASIVTKLWSRRFRESEARRIRGWERVDDQC
jgi:hypothetical protein